MVTWEEYQLDFAGSVSGISGNRIFFGSVDQAYAWMTANSSTAGVMILSKRVISYQQMATYGTPVSPTIPTSQNKIPSPASQTHTRIGTPNVPPGFTP
jgi:hypothetical protein